MPDPATAADASGRGRAPAAGSVPGAVSREVAGLPAGPVTGPVRLAGLTTIGLGGPAPALYRAVSTAEIAEVVGDLDMSGGALILGGGSNLVIADSGIEVPVVSVVIAGIQIYDAPPGPFDAIARIGAGENWDRAVAQLVAEGWAGVQELSGIPGSAGATPVQNVGAYGTEIADVLVDVEIYDRVARSVRRVPAAELALGYRSSALRGTDAAVVTEVRLGLTRRPGPVRYPELARLLGVAVGEAAPAPAVREAVLDLRRRKGMVLDPADADTRSVGSFFTNPIVSDEQLAQVRAAAARLGADRRLPEYPAVGGTKLSAAWLIEQAGFARGYPLATRPRARIALSTKHTLALTNRGGGTAAELIALAREIRAGVAERFGVLLQAEPILLGVGLDQG